MLKREDYSKGLENLGVSDIYGELTFEYKRRKNIKIRDLPQIGSSIDLFNYIYPVYENMAEEREMFYVVYINKSNRVLGRWLASLGSLDGTVVPVDMAVARALLLQAKAAFAVHNHPSGTLKPSVQDTNITEKLKRALNVHEIQLLDHLIIGQDGEYLSFQDEGLGI